MPRHKARMADIGSGLTARREADGGLSILRDGELAFPFSPISTLMLRRFLAQNPPEKSDIAGAIMSKLDGPAPRLGPRGGELRYPEWGERYWDLVGHVGRIGERYTCGGLTAHGPGKCRPEDHEIIPSQEPAP